MALLTLGTIATTSLSALAYSPVMTQADFASLQQSIKFDGVEGSKTVPAALTRSGLLFVPRRGVLQLLAGDYVGVDSVTGWPIVVSAAAIAAGGTKWAHS